MDALCTHAACNDKIPLINQSQINRSFFDSVFSHVDSDKFFSLDIEETYFVERTSNIEVKGRSYEAAKVQYLNKGDNVDQEFLLYVVKGKGVYIQQENNNKKLYLLMNIIQGGKSENTSDLTEKMLDDTILFPLSSKLIKMN